jgi:hypothetical protein
VGEQAQLARSVLGLLHDVGAQGAQRRLGRQRLAQGLGDVRHLVRRVDALGVQPAEDLLGAVGGRARGLHARRQLGGRQGAKIQVHQGAQR